MNYRKYSDLRELINIYISIIQSKDFDLIVGASRNGMIPAYMVALYLNKNCCDLDSFMNNRALKTGITRKAKGDLKYPKEATNILFLEDYIDSSNFLSNSIKEFSNLEESNVTTLAIYASEKAINEVDIIFECVSGKISFEWNIFNQQYTESSCFDIDGVLCIDPTLEQDDDGEKYKKFLLNAPSLFKPSGKVNYLVTSRLKKYRSETELWLKKNKIQYGDLIMLDLGSKEERQKLGINANHKAEAYVKSEQHLFFESSRTEAKKIYELTKKPVYCVDTNEMFSNEMMKSKVNHNKELPPKHSKRSLYIIKILDKLPKPFYNSLRAVYRFFAY
ncbi:hypothetical protein ACM26V_05825 [Salipaludibacillus sp. HK11]|uniref:hypothetical protein n=1 Tax=Salipaludibacillus sp. HK11 TaxID=3394320 RepID=UPI0039FD847D